MLKYVRKKGLKNKRIRKFKEGNIWRGINRDSFLVAISCRKLLETRVIYR